MTRRLAVAAACILLAACCDQAAVQACQAERAAKDAKALAQGRVANGPDENLELNVATVEGVTIDAAVVEAGCSDGHGANARVRVEWAVKLPGVSTVRILVGSGNEANKTWVEAGASGAEVTGPWINDGALLRMESLASRETLGLIRAKARACQ